MTVWIVLHYWYEEIDEYGAHHNDEFVSVHRTKQAADDVVASQSNSEEDHYYIVERYV